jgi:hypothetical protein
MQSNPKRPKVIRRGCPCCGTYHRVIINPQGKKMKGKH